VPALLPRTPVADGETRYIGATLLDGTLREPIQDSEVVVRDGLIAYAGSRRIGTAATGSRTIDLAGTFLLPGFIDAHVHLAMVSDPAEQRRTWFPEETPLAVAAILRATLHAGVTTARDLDGLTPGYRDAIARGLVPGPRMHLAIAMLSPTGGHADPVLPNGSLPAWASGMGLPEPGVVDTDDDIIRTVRTLVRTGADAIKVSASGGVGSPTDDPTDVGITEEQIRLIARLVAERGGRPITAHALTDASARSAVLGGVASIEHGYDLSDETIALFLEHGTVLVPTLSTLMRELGPDASADRRRARAALQERGLDSVRRAVAAGVPVALGTDAGVHPHGRNLRELAWLVHVGLSPLAAIHAGTVQGATLLGLDDHIGSVAEGKVADLVVSAIDPCEEIERMTEPAAIRMVIQSGHAVLDRDSRAR
jgi:imidazolonepropionase-like amidohydrolase